MRETLNSLGYVYCTPEEALSHLSTRISYESFPHEIGFFLGYPVKDVLGFMGILNIPLTFNGPWKVYGEKQASLQVVKSHRSPKASVVCSLDSGVSPLTLLKESSTLAA